jgi:hypothetical protein
MAPLHAGTELIVAIQEIDARMKRSVKRIRGDEDDLDLSSKKTLSFKQDGEYEVDNETRVINRDIISPRIDVKTALDFLRAPDRRRLSKLSPTGILGTGAESVVLSTGRGVALKYSPPSTDALFNASHEYNIMKCWAPAGLSFEPIDLINPPDDAKSNMWKGSLGARFLAASSPESRITRVACKELVSVIAMEAADGTLDRYIAYHSNLQSSEVIGEAVLHLLSTARRLGAVHNDAKADNVGYRIGCSPLFEKHNCPIFLFVDCRNAVDVKYFRSKGVNKEKLNSIIDMGCRRDALCLCRSLLLLAEKKLTGDRALYSRQIAGKIWPFGWRKTQCNADVKKIMSLDTCTAEAQRLWRRIDAHISSAILNNSMVDSF